MKNSFLKNQCSCISPAVLMDGGGKNDKIVVSDFGRIARSIDADGNGVTFGYAFGWGQELSSAGCRYNGQIFAVSIFRTIKL
ncbi:hypothetical protein BN2497_11633 [Janthinobacterium sp. CG23_2]|nr:hypothetical protein BN2497_11633 [Janthinobacterium sp. CG23_2]CUU32214.1 hypothetical protein BN3177_11633 [Janthinobacterium sp. CG23_2]